ncbi:DUF2612 domain-containing protein [Enterobacteriaceae bacterium H20N1]|uniref:DUF2612 domain-containing protein n=1 Tax=Dryocola boscaweniae TaxID=2925397 RepID=A0A9X2W641_9ENTR|nr:DUF2612 domain-containing protein [Dryocola boscaweniae]MCT4701515.1 DUF2612 domain-containing protein [Dryocola boscaweniae]MCT4718574.1 DUF2612 domain-containing protein [Dryocola boscaweniae]
MSNRYSELIPSWQQEAPKFFTTVEAVTTAFTAQQLVNNSLIPHFDLDKASGAQLDILGQWIGQTRRITAPIEDFFFSLDSVDLGFDYGYWKNRYDAEFGFIDLDDGNYRTVLRAKIGANNWDGTNETLPAILQNIYPKKDILISFSDNQDMTMTVSVKGKSISNITKEIIRQGYLAIKPGGITVHYEITEG